jgi:hypothetical protein
MAKKSKAKAAEQLVFTAASVFDRNTTESSFNTSTQAGLEAWIYWHYCHNAFHPAGTFKGLVWLKKYLASLDTSRSPSSIKRALQP